MKKWVAVALAAALLITMPSNVQKVSAKEKESGKDLTTEATKEATLGTAAVNGFVIENGVLTDYVGTATNITVPNGVTSIGMYAFIGCDITNVTLPSGVLTIGEGAFGECYNLTTINIPNTVTSIGQSAFFDCYDLKSLSLPSSVNSIGEDAFGMCLGMESLFFYNKSATIDGIHNKPTGSGYVSIFPESCTVYCYQNSAVHAAAISWNQPCISLMA